jgi:hypothetical protein
MNKIKEIASTTHANIVASIYQDEDAEPPESDIVKIAYLGKARNTLGSQPCTSDELDQIGQDIESGLLVGVRVWAYVHSGATISTGSKLPDGTRLRENPYHCQWDSGRSGWAYMTAKAALKEWGNKRLSPKQRDKAHQYIDGVVDEFAMYLRGEVYGYVIERIECDDAGEEIERKHLDSCWGFYGEEYVTCEAMLALAQAIDIEPAYTQEELFPTSA